MKRLTLKEWNAVVPRVKDLSDQLADEFLMFGQFMRAKIELDGKIYLASGWSIGKGYVDLVEV